MKPGIYRHYKGKNYRVIGVGRHSETLEDLVFYQALYDSPEFGNASLWARPLNMSADEVEFQGKKVSRFEFISD